jgi:hypothetical protein
MNHSLFVATSAPFEIKREFPVDEVVSLLLGFVVGCIGIFSYVRDSAGYRRVRHPIGS